MQLTQEQIDQYRDRGYLLVPGVFDQEEIEFLRGRLPALYADDSERRVVEEDGESVRSIYGSNSEDPVLDRLTRLPRLVRPARQLLDNDVYVYQFKVNAKAAFKGDVWEWHQDYIFWLKEDGLERPDLTNVVVFFDEVTEFNGPLLFLAGSQREGTIDLEAKRRAAAAEDDPDWLGDLTADLKFSLDRHTVADLAERYEMVAPKGPAGSVLFFHPNAVHGSGTNLSPWDRALSIVTYCDVSNVVGEVASPRPDFLVNRDPRPLEMVEDDTLAPAAVV